MDIPTLLGKILVFGQIYYLEVEKMNRITNIYKYVAKLGNKLTDHEGAAAINIAKHNNEMEELLKLWHKAKDDDLVMEIKNMINKLEYKGKILLISDIDGVVCDTVSKVLEWINWYYRVLLDTDDIKEYNVEKGISYAIGDETKEKEIGETLWNNCWTNAEFLKNGVYPHYEILKGIKYWVDNKLPVKFTTRRNPELYKITKEWLTEYLGEGGWELHMLAEKAEIIKQSLKQYDRVIFLEDSLKYASEVNNLPNVDLFVPARPWNNDSSFKRLDGASIREILISTANASIIKERK